MIRAYTGRPGTGKTCGMVYDAMNAVKTKKVQIFTNLVGLKFPEAVWMCDLQALNRIGQGLVLLDEASVCMASRYWHEVPKEVLSTFAQSRHYGLDIWYTTQHLNRVDTVVRDITQEEVCCQKLGAFN